MKPALALLLLALAAALAFSASPAYAQIELTEAALESTRALDRWSVKEILEAIHRETRSLKQSRQVHLKFRKPF